MLQKLKDKLIDDSAIDHMLICNCESLKFINKLLDVILGLFFEDVELHVLFLEEFKLFFGNFGNLGGEGF